MENTTLENANEIIKRISQLESQKSSIVAAFKIRLMNNDRDMTDLEINIPANSQELQYDEKLSSFNKLIGMHALNFIENIGVGFDLEINRLKAEFEAL